MTSSDELLSVEDVVKRYKGKIKAGTLANWRITKKGPPFMKLGGRIMYPLDKLEEWEKSCLRVSTIAAAMTWLLGIDFLMLEFMA